MSSTLADFVRKLQANKSLHSLDEASTKQSVIYPILARLGWDTYDMDQFRVEYSVGTGRVDIALRQDGINKVFIEAKKAGCELDSHQEQILSYSFKDGVQIAVLTNGVTWWFYLPLREGSWEQRKFHTIELYDQNPDDIAIKFESILGHSQIASGEAIETAQNFYDRKYKKKLIAAALPQAWEKIVREPHELFIELIADTAEKTCGFRPDNESVANFIDTAILAPQSTPEPTEQRTVTQRKSPKFRFIDSNLYKNRTITWFELEGKRYRVKTWKEMLMTICSLILRKQQDNLSRTLQLRGRKRPYFSRTGNELRVPERVADSSVFVETNLSADQIVVISRQVLSLYGYSNDDLLIECLNQ